MPKVEIHGTSAHDGKELDDALVINKALAVTGTGFFGLNVVLGNIEGYSGIDKFGENPVVGNVQFDHIWDKGGQYVPPVTAVAHNVVSDSMADAGTEVTSGTATGGSTTSLEDTGTDFSAAGVVVGMMVLDDTHCEIGFVTSVTETVLTIAAAMRSPSTGNTGLGFAESVSYRIVNDASTGSSVLYVQGLDILRMTIQEFVILNGQTDVLTVKEYGRMYRARTFAVATSGTIGVVTATTDDVAATVSLQIIDGNNQTLMAVYTVPFGKKGFVLQWWASLSKKQSAAAIVRLRAGILDGVGYTVQTRAIETTGTSEFTYNYALPLVNIPGGADIWVEAQSDSAQADVGVSAGFDILLIDD